MNDLYQRTTALGLEPAQIDAIAYVAHDAVRAWARTNGDFTHDLWSNCSAEHKTSMRTGVLARLEKPDESAEDNHNRWLEHKANDGWTYGPERDEAHKRSPAFVPWSDLPVDFRARNEIFMGIVKALDPRKYT